MKRIKKCILILFLFFTTLSNIKGQNPIIQTNYTADPAPMVYNDTVFVYTSHDEDSTVNNFFTMNDWRCYSSVDMVNWTDCGVILSYETFKWSRGDAWAGQCIERNGKFYYYLPVNQKNGGNAIGVAVSDSPTGSFKDALGKPLLEGYGYIDPTVFIDDDGQAYLYWGNPNLWHVKLNEDMVSYNQDYGIVKEDLREGNFGYRPGNDQARTVAYEEGPWLYKRNDLYYLFYPAGGVPEHLAYSTAKSITGPWMYGDTIMQVIEKGGAFTNHPGVIDFKGKHYLFYHNGDLPGGGGFKRSVCIEQFDFNIDGSISLIKPTIEGVREGVACLNPFEKVEAETMAYSQGLKTATDNQVGVYVTKIDNGDYIKVRNVDFRNGAKQFIAHVSSVDNSGSIEIRLDNYDGKTIGNCQINNIDGFKNWEMVSCSVEKETGVHDVFLVFKGKQGELFNFDWYKFQ